MHQLARVLSLLSFRISARYNVTQQRAATTRVTTRVGERFSNVLLPNIKCYGLHSDKVQSHEAKKKVPSC